MLVCVRPMTQTGTQDRKKSRAKDTVICKCGQPICRDSDLKGGGN
jgi:hypothetical protein